jgi:hypothetical protein
VETGIGSQLHSFGDIGIADTLGESFLTYLTLFPLMRYAYDANSITNIPRLKLDGWMKAKEGTKDT